MKLIQQDERHDIPERFGREGVARMSSGEGAHGFLHALKARRALVFKTMLGILLAAGVVAFVTRQYSASAVVALNPNARSNPGMSPVEVAWSALTDEKISALIQQFQLGTELAQLRSGGEVFTYLRSNISFDPAGSAERGSPQIVVSYTGEGRAAVVDVANAIARILSETQAPARTPGSAAATAPSAAQSIAKALQQSRANLQLLAQSPHGNLSRSDVEKHLKTDVALKAAQRDIMLQLAALEQESQRDLAAISKARTPPPPPPPDPARIALQQQIEQAQDRLSVLRQKYTDEYPDVEDAKVALAGLEAKLARLPIEKPRPQPHVDVSALQAELATIAQQQDDLRAEESGLEQKIKANADQAELLRQRLADQEAVAQDYAQEQQRYHALLQAQQAAAAQGGSQTGAVDNAGAGSVPLFIVVSSAAASRPLSIALKLPFWIASLGVALLAASFAVFLAEQFDPFEEKEEIRAA